MSKSNLVKIKKVKLDKIEALRKKGIEPYPEINEEIIPIAVARKQFDDLVLSQKKIYLAGRVMAKREHGGSTFIDLYDGTAKVQVYLKQDSLGPDKYKLLLDYIDMGDFIASRGSFFITRKGEQTQELSDFIILSKAVLPLPEKWHGLADVEERFRKRYLDLLMNEEVTAKFIKRSQIIRALRKFLEQESFMEVETPILQTIPGGALAKPFKTRLNALKMDLHLRVAPELYLKRLLVGGYPRVYEIGRCFRNEGMDATHNPDFTMLECYAAYKNYQDFMDMTEKLIKSLITDVLPGSGFQIERDGQIIGFQQKFVRAEMTELIKKHTGIDYDILSVAELSKEAKKLKIKIPKGAGKGKIADEIYKEMVRPHLVQPTFVINHPIELSPLAKKLTDNPTKTARFQLVVAGMEIANAYSELNDPQEQLERFKIQEKIAKKGDEEAQRMDMDFIEALEYGMPPAAGLGIGIERLVALFTNSHSIRETMLFPTMRPKK
ncbi:MAG: lysine--tRNA ligase, partial [Patescibacteria group bacterium]